MQAMKRNYFLLPATITNGGLISHPKVWILNIKKYINKLLSPDIKKESIIIMASASSKSKTEKQNTETLDPHYSKYLFISFILMLMIFVIDIQLPLGVAGGVPYIAVILVALWLHNQKIVIGLAILCSILVLAGFYLSPPGGELWKVLFNRSLALLAIWVTTVLATKWTISEQNICNIINETEKEKEKIYLATIHGAQHITNNLLNQLQLVEVEIENHPEFDKEILVMFNKMMVEANTLMKELSTVEKFDEETIKQAIYPKINT